MALRDILAPATKDETPAGPAVDTRPTKEQFAAMGHSQRQALIHPIDLDGKPFTAESAAAFRADLQKRQAAKKTRKPTVLNGGRSTQQSAGVRKNQRTA